MIPLRDVIPSRTTPWITLALIAANSVVFLYELLVGRDEASRFIYTFGLTPSAFSWITVVSALFIHAGWLHIGGNLLSLWIFGGSVEDRMGHGRFALFYFLAGLIGNLVHTAANTSSNSPLVGASGAVAGVMGAYLLMFPSSRILVLIFLFVFVDVVEIPAVFFMVFWLFIQLLNGVGQLATLPGASVAFWPEAGGFIAGVTGVWIFRRPERQRVDWWG
jgi:membrane associated rhomboid family serine protease